MASMLEEVCRPGSRAVTQRDWRNIAAEVADWTPIIKSALGHGVAGLLSHALLEQAPDQLPTELSSALDIYRAHCQARDDARVAQLCDALTALHAAGVPALPFKGPALARLAYDKPALRESGDLDLLITEPDVERAIHCLESRFGFNSLYPHLRPALRRAYYRYHGQDALCAAGRIPIEPHWSFAPRTLAAHLDAAPMFARAQPVQIGGRAVATLAPEDALLVACLHGFKDEWCRLINVADVAGLLAHQPDLDAAAVLSRATAAGLRRILLTGAALAHRLLDAAVPPPIEAAIEADHQLAPLVADTIARLRRPGVTQSSVFTLSPLRRRMRERPLDRIRYVARTLLTARVPHYGVIELPDALIPLYPAVRVAHDFVALPLWRLVQRAA